MVLFVLKRLIQSVFVMIAVAFLAFSLFRFVGDPVSQMTGVETSVEDRERLREELGLNDAFVLQFARFTNDMLRGEFGYSYRTRQPVAAMIVSRMPATLELGIVALLISLVVGIPAGVYAALKPRGVVTQTILLTTLVGVSIPTFVIGIMLIFLFGADIWAGWHCGGWGLDLILIHY
jgi:peptide/nickel transport system permease protein